MSDKLFWAVCLLVVSIVGAVVYRVLGGEDYLMSIHEIHGVWKPIIEQLHRADGMLTLMERYPSGHVPEDVRKEMIEEGHNCRKLAERLTELS